MHPLHRETHLIERIGWLRAAVLGANDGIISTASLLVGVAAAATAPSEVLVAGFAGLVAGEMSRRAGSSGNGRGAAQDLPSLPTNAMRTPISSAPSAPKEAWARPSLCPMLTPT